jgi:hypothetical protein
LPHGTMGGLSNSATLNSVQQSEQPAQLRSATAVMTSTVARICP